MKIAARYLQGDAVEVEIEGPRFVRVTPLRDSSDDLPWIAPGLIDLQINGFAGIDFNRALASDDAWEHATQQLYAHGCTGFLIALITNREEGYRELLPALVARLRKDPRNCLGLHMEGPWLNPDPGYRGAHRAEWMQKPTLRLLSEWQAIAGDFLRLVTLAPEVDLEESLRVIRAGREAGIQFFVGHSAAMGHVLEAALAAGAIGWTHLGNAAPAQMPKFENVLLHALAQPALAASLISDGLHLPAHAFRALARALDAADPSRLLLTTDAMAGAAAQTPGRFTLGEVEAEVGLNGAARLPSPDGQPGRLAGSTLTPFDGILRACEMSGLGLEQIWSAFSSSPARVLGLRSEIAVGNLADFCLLSPEETPRLLATYHRGQRVFSEA